MTHIEAGHRGPPSCTHGRPSTDPHQALEMIHGALPASTRVALIAIGGVGTHLNCLPALRAILGEFRPRVTVIANYMLPHVADERSHHPFVFDEFEADRVLVTAWKNG